MQKKSLATAAVASTLGGALAGAAFLAPTFAGAQDDPGTTTPDTTTPDTTAPDAGDDAVRPEPGERITEVLQGLVDDGTLTQAQLDAVVETLVNARQEFGPRGHGHGGGFAGGADIADLLGLEQSELRDAIAGGQSLADIAAEQGVDTQDLVDAIVAATEERVATAVENGRIDQEKADEILDNAATRAEDLVNGDIDFEARRGHRGGEGGFGRPGADAGGEATPDA